MSTGKGKRLKRVKDQNDIFGHSITVDQIMIESDIKILQLYDLYIVARGNQHITAKISGILSEESMKVQGDIQPTVMKISYWSEKTQSLQVLFSGILSNITYKKVGEIPFVELELHSGTILLDHEKRCRSFQNANDFYQTIIAQVLDKTEGAMYVDTVGERAIGKPLIQYQETDWEFLRRLASHFYTAIYPDMKSESARLCFGFPEGNEELELDSEMDYTAGISKEYLDSGEPSGWYVYYEVELAQEYEIGTTVFFHKKMYQIEQKEVELKHGILIFRYRLRLPNTIYVNKTYNPIFTGMSILGTVLSVEGETLKLQFDIDEKQSESEAYAYSWTPDTGSTMYVMPKVGTKVSLYFMGQNEQNAKVTSCVRENGSSKSKGNSGSSGSSSTSPMSDPNKRGLTTEYGKALFLDPEAMGVKSENHSLSIVDDQGISWISNKPIALSSGKKITIKGKKVSFSTPKEIAIRRG